MRRRRRMSRSSMARENTPVIRRRAIVRGLVQGVFFRDSARRLARQHGVAGWISNRWDGSVEAVFEGESEGVERLGGGVPRGPRGAHGGGGGGVGGGTGGPGGFEGA